MGRTKEVGSGLYSNTGRTWTSISGTSTAPANNKQAGRRGHPAAITHPHTPSPMPIPLG